MNQPQTSAVSQRFQTFSALRYNNYRWFWINSASQGMAMGMQYLALGWLVLETTGSSIQLGLVIFAYGVPNLVFSLPGGVIADRVNRLALLIATQVAVAALIFALGISETAGHLQIWQVYAVMVLLGSVQAINMPARMALVADLVERRDVANAMALFTMVNQAGQIVGPGLAGGVIELAGMGATLFLNAGLFLAGTAFLLMIKGLPPRPASLEKPAVLRDLQAGLQCIRNTPVLYTVIGLALAFTFFSMSYRQVLPAFAEDMLGVGAGGTGLLWLGAGLGSLLGSLILATLGDFPRKAWLFVGSLMLVCVSLVSFGWSPWYWPSWVLFFVLGTASTGLFWPLANVLVQLNAPVELRGRALSVLQLAPAIHNLSGLLLAVTAEFIGWPLAVTGAAAVTFAVALWLGIWRPVLRQFVG